MNKQTNKQKHNQNQKIINNGIFFLISSEKNKSFTWALNNNVCISVYRHAQIRSRLNNVVNGKNMFTSSTTTTTKMLMMMMMTMGKWPSLCVFVCIGNKNVNSIDQKKKKENGQQATHAKSHPVGLD